MSGVEVLVAVAILVGLAGIIVPVLPGAVLIDSVDALCAHIATVDLGPSGWVLKAPFSASGRLRVRRRGRVLDGGIDAWKRAGYPMAVQSTGLTEP